MRTTLIAFASTITLSSALLVGGCKSSPAPAPPAQQPAQSTAGTPGAYGNAAQPAPGAGAGVAAPGSVPATSSTSGNVAPAGPAVSQPATAAAAPAPVAPRVLTAPAGSRVAVTITETLKASTSNVGDGFTGVLAEPLVARGGGTVFARGTRVAGSVVAAKGRGRFKGAGALGIQLTSIGGVRVTSSEYEKAEKGKGKRTGALVGGGAGLGAIIGGLAGGGKGALIGGLAGAGAGTAGAAYTGNHDVVIPSESLITFRLETAVTR